MLNKPEPWTLERLANLTRGYMLPAVIGAAIQSGALRRLTEGPIDAASLGATIDVDEDALARVLNVLVSQGILLKSSNGVYSLPDHLAEELAGTEIGCPLDGLTHTAEGLQGWSSILEVLGNGHAEYPDSLDVTLDPGRNERFIRAMHMFAAPAARHLTEIMTREDARTLLDIGGGPGTFSLALASAWPDLHATVADLPLTLRVTKQVVAESGLSDRVDMLEADFFADRACNLGGPYDLVLVSAVIHAEGEEENRDLFSRLHAATNPGGRIVVREQLLSPDRGSPTPAALFDVHMLVSTRRGRCYTEADIGLMLEDAGFKTPRLLSSFEDGFVIADR